MPDLSTSQLGQIAQTLGALGVMAAALIAFVKDWIMTKATADRLIAASGAAAAREIERLQQQNQELTRTNALLHELATRSTGSQSVQAQTIAEAMSAMTALAEQLRAGTLPALPAPAAPAATP